MSEEPEKGQGRKNYAYRNRREVFREPGKVAKDGVLLDCPPLVNGRNSNFMQWSKKKYGQIRGRIILRVATATLRGRMGWF
jgi:hypothetical protein